MKILITGGAGFLGTNLAQHAIEKDHELYILDNLYRPGSEDNLKYLKGLGDFDFRYVDMRNSQGVRRNIKEIKPDLIFHLAGQTAMTTSLEKPRLDHEINVGGTFNLLEAVRKEAPDSIVIFSSTNKVYGDLEYLDYEENDSRYIAKNYKEGFDESLKLDFHSPYGCSKGAADQYMLDYARMYGLRTVVFRHSSMFGYRQFATEDQGWIGWFCQKALEDEPFTISGDGKQVRDILFADDLIRCYYGAAEKIDKIAGEAFNIGGGVENSLSLLELFGFLETTFNKKLDYKETDWRRSDQKVFIADNSKITKYTNWEPEIDKYDGIARMLQWTKKKKMMSGGLR